MVTDIEFLSQPVRYLKGVGPKRAELLAKLDIFKVEDLLNHFPREYLDCTQVRLIRDLQPHEIVTIQGTIGAIHEIHPFRRGRSLRHILKVTIIDDSGIIHAVWFNQPYRTKQFQEGQTIIITGKTRFNAGLLELDPIEYEMVDDSEANKVSKLSILPIYPTTEGVEQRFLRNLVSHILEQLKSPIPEILPEDIIQKYKFPSRDIAIRRIHYPDSLEYVSHVRNRFVYEEFFFIQLALAIQKSKVQQIIKQQQYKPESTLIDRLLEQLPFELTQAQVRVIKEITQDLQKPNPMNRLLQGDVGSGKTLVALLAMLKCVENGYQSCLMVPTEVLAEQHYQTFENWLTPLKIPIALLTGSTKSKKRKEILDQIQSGKIQIIIGTHALLEEPVQFKDLALVVIDEQHRFGVTQRYKLRKKGQYPDLLIMTATPIPRTLSMTVYGDLDISTLDELPKGRPNIITQWYSEKHRSNVYDLLRQEVKTGRQVYIIYPLVEESDKMELRAAVQMYEHLKKDIFSEFQLGLIHGRMKRSEQQPIMEQFMNRHIDILVSTTVIEVGINVPNATVMVIEHAERFGLSQLHQLRGRVGRGKYQSYCIFITPENMNSLVQERLNILTQTRDGFMIAEKDLRLRGPGETLGIQQHGLNMFRIVDMEKDKDWLILARTDAFHLITNDPQLQSAKHKFLKRIMETKIGIKQHYATVS